MRMMILCMTVFSFVLSSCCGGDRKPEPTNLNTMVSWINFTRQPLRQTASENVTPQASFQILWLTEAGDARIHMIPPAEPRPLDDQAIRVYEELLRANQYELIPIPMFTALPDKSADFSVSRPMGDESSGETRLNIACDTTIADDGQLRLTRMRFSDSGLKVLANYDVNLPPGIYEFTAPAPVPPAVPSPPRYLRVLVRFEPV